MPTPADATVTTLGNLSTYPDFVNICFINWVNDGLGNDSSGFVVGMSIDDDVVIATDTTIASGECFFILPPASPGSHVYRLHYPATSGAGTRIGNSVTITWTSGGSDPYIEHVPIDGEGADETVVIDTLVPFVSFWLISSGDLLGPRSLTPRANYATGFLRNTTGSPSYPADITTSVNGGGPWVDNDPTTGPVNGTNYYYKMRTTLTLVFGGYGGTQVALYESNVISVTPHVRNTKNVDAFSGMENGFANVEHLHTGNDGMDPGTIVTGQYGRPGKQFKAVNTSSTTDGYSVRLAIGGNPTATTVAGLYWGIDNFPTGIDRAVILSIGPSTFGALTGEAVALRLRSDGYVEAGFTTPPNEIQRLIRTGSPTGGTFTLTFSSQVTSSIPYNCTAAQVQTALEGLAAIGVGDVTVTGGPFPLAIDVEFTGALAETNWPLMTVSSSLTPSGSVSDSTIQQGGATGGVWRPPLRSGAVVSNVYICPQRWYRFDVYLDTSTDPFVLRWSINNVAQTNVTHSPGSVTLPVTNWGQIGAHGEGAIDNPINTQTSYSTDFAVVTDATQYPLGPRRSLLLLPNGFGFNSNVVHFSDETGAAISGSSWSVVADAPPLQTGIADVHSLRMLGGSTTGDWLEFTIEDFLLTPDEEIVGVHVYYSGYKSSTTPSNSSQFTVDVSYDSLLTARVDSLASGSSASIRAQPFGTTTGLYRIVPEPLGGWTQKAISSLTVKWQPNTDAGGSDPSTRYFGLSALMIGVHLQNKSGDEFVSLGCPQEKWGMI